jgi:acetyltransferase
MTSLQTSLNERGTPPMILRAAVPDTVRRSVTAAKAIRGLAKSDALSGVRVRPVAPTDGERIQALVRSLSLESRRARFFAPVRELSREQLERMTELAFPGAVGIVAETVDARRDLLAIAQYAADEDGPEFAVVVADAWQGRGVGRRLVGQLAALAGVAGFAVLRGFVLRSNAAMIGLARSLGFTVSGDSDPELYRLAKPLARARAG